MTESFRWLAGKSLESLLEDVTFSDRMDTSRPMEPVVQDTGNNVGFPRRHMNTNNPYASPQSQTNAHDLRAEPIIRRRLSVVFLLVSVGVALAYTFLDEVVLQTAMGAWPLLLATAILAAVAAYRTRDWLVAPMCCFCGVMSGAVLASYLRSWEYSQFRICALVALGFSIPAFVIALVKYLDAKHDQQQT